MSRMMKLLPLLQEEIELLSLSIQSEQVQLQMPDLLHPPMLMTAPLVLTLQSAFVAVVVHVGAAV